MMHLLAQLVSTSEGIDILAKVGWPGAVLWIVVRRLDSLEHAMKGVSKALWMDLASRPDAAPFVKAEAKRMIDRDRSKGSD